jgi:cysteine desulfurase/selenocysteine lyase
MDLRIKKDFPIFNNHKDLVYLDSAATSQKPKVVIDTVKNFYTKYNSNIHRGIYDLSQEATQMYEDSRAKIANFINASNPEEIVFTGNASESINLVAYAYARKFIKRGDIIVTSEMEHHSNFVPWLEIQKSMGVRLYFLPITENYELDYQKLLDLPKSKIKLIAITNASNVLGTINPIAKISRFLDKNKIKAKFLVDGAQSIPHLPTDVDELGCDFFAFSSHKMLGPSGLGVLWAKKDLLETMDPLFFGGNMIMTVTKKSATWADIPNKFEAGTGKLEAVIGLGAAIDYLNELGMENVEKYEREITQYALNTLRSIEGIKIHGKLEPKNRLGVFSFALDRIHPHDVGDILNRKHVCIRTGHHCAQPLMKILGENATARASTYIYNTKKDIDKLAEGIMEVKRILKHG